MFFEEAGQPGEGLAMMWISKQQNDVQRLNDDFRHAGPVYGDEGRWVMTRGVQAFDVAGVADVVRHVQRFDVFTEDNDPYGTHDFGAFEYAGEQHAVHAARRLFFAEENAAPLIRQQAAQLLRRTGNAAEIPEVPAGEEYSPISFWRARTRLHPRDPLAWTELSLEHTINGHLGPAKKAMGVALQLAGDNRHVLRSGSRLYLQEQYDEVLLACERWSNEERYSIRPFEFGSAVAGYAAQYDKAALLAERGLRMRPGAPKLVNALAFALGSMNRLDEAELALAGMPLDIDDNARNVAAANRGLIAFRRGDLEQARSRYRDAITGFQKVGDRAAQASAMVYLAHEAVIAGDPEALVFVEGANKAWRQQSPQKVHPMLSDIDARLAGRALENAQAPAVQSGNQNVIASRDHERASAFTGATWSIAMKIGRNASSGKFTTVKQAQAKPRTHVVETVKPAPKGK